MEQCRYFEMCGKMINEEIKNNAIQEASIKSLHKRMDADGKVREESKNRLIKLESSLVHHMEWEERQYKLKKEQDEKKEKQNNRYFWLASIAITIITGVSSWAFLNIIDTSKNLAVLTNTVEDLATTQKDLLEYYIKENKK